MKLISKHNLALLIGIFAWVGYTAIEFYEQIGRVRMQGIQQNLAFGVFLAGVLYFTEGVVERVKKFNVLTILWKLLITGLVGLLLIWVLKLIQSTWLGERMVGKLFLPLNESIALFAYVFFSGMSLFSFRRMIFFNKTRGSVNWWKGFMVLLALGALMLLLPEDMYGDERGRMKSLGLLNIFRILLGIAFILTSLILSVRLNWSAYLRWSDKLRVLAIEFPLALVMAGYSSQFPYDLMDNGYGAMYMFNLTSTPYFILSQLFIFPLIYVVLSALVVFFNLFTSSVFEQRKSEIESLQRITHKIQMRTDVEETLRELLDACILTSNSLGGWIETVSPGIEGPKFTLFLERNLMRDEIHALNPYGQVSERVIRQHLPEMFNNLKHLTKDQNIKSSIKSMIAVPVKTGGNEPLAVMYLVSEVANPWQDDNTVDSIRAYAEQASVAVENSRLLKDSIELERLRENSRIARQVQERILPKALPKEAGLEFFALSESSEVMGGDYFDVVKTGDGMFKVALGDVSGKGTEAAFHMAETKGIFQALTLLDLDPRAFIIHANAALKACMQPGVFMTLTYLEIRPREKKVRLLRAGHCPALFYSHTTGELRWLDHGTLGLGILSGNTFPGFVPEPEEIRYDAGDVLFLYTDGIIEARNARREEWGYDRLKAKFGTLCTGSVEGIGRSVLEEVRRFSGSQIEDDYTLMVIKFLQ